jgi:ABC-type glycerol-3-phosphate transport system substrate-binding protein
LVEYADKLTRFGFEGQLDRVGFLPDKPTSHLWIYTYLHGGFWYSEDLAKLMVNNQSVKDALLWESQFYTKYDSDLVNTFLVNKGEDLFLDGSVAMVIAPAGMIFPEDLNVGVSHIPFPSEAFEQSGTFLFGGNTIIVPKIADSQKIMNFIEWMISPEISAQVACVEKNYSTNRESLRNPCFSDRLDVGNYIPMLESNIGYVRLSTPASSELETALRQVEKQVLSSGADPGSNLELIQTQLEARYLEVINPH